MIPGHGNRHGDKKPYRCACGSACVRALRHTIGFHRLYIACNGRAGRTHERTVGCARDVRQCRRRFEQILAQRRAQIDAKQPLPNLPGQALYLARIKVMSTYKDLTDALPSRIGRPNKFGVPPAYFDADIEPLIEEYAALFDIMQAPPADAQASDTPFKDVVDLGTAIARAKGLDAATADAAGRISLGLFFAETNGNQNIGNARSNKYKGSLQTGVAEDRNGQQDVGGDQAEDRGASIPRWSPATTRRRRASASATSATITGPRCATG